jgi:prepilin-type N-terminal cleavage/methylation domain-containing protein
MRTGYTLLEVALVLVIIGLLLGIAVPRFATFRDTLDVEQAAQTIASAHRRARITAILNSRLTVLSVGPDSLTIGPPDSAATWGAAGPRASGIRLEGPMRQIVFSPVGVTMGVSNASFRLSRGVSSRSVIVSRLGRVRIQRGR